MKIVRNSIVVVAALLLAGMAVAQGGGGQRRGGFGGMMNDAGSMLQRTDVKEELKLSDDELAKVKDVSTKVNSERQEMFQAARDSGDFQSAMTGMVKKMPEWEKQYFGAISADHLKRLKQLMVQRSGNQIVLDANFQGDLGITDAQKTKLTDLQTKSREAMMSLGQKVRDQEMTMEELQTAMKKNTEVMDTEIGKILTDAQRSKLKDMAGAPFKFVDNSGGI